MAICILNNKIVEIVENEDKEYTHYFEINIKVPNKKGLYKNVVCIPVDYWLVYKDEYRKYCYVYAKYLARFIFEFCEVDYLMSLEQFNNIVIVIADYLKNVHKINN